MGLILSEEAADTLMELLPPVGWADVATKTDLQHLRNELKGDINSLRVATKSDLQHQRHQKGNTTCTQPRGNVSGNTH